MVPPWVPSPTDGDAPADGPPPADGQPPDQGKRPQTPIAPIPIAPARRFGSTRGSLGNFARTGDVASLRRGLGHYVRTGYGGSGTAVRRSGGTASTAGALYGALSGIASGAPVAAGSPLDPALLAGRSVRDVVNAVVEAVRPIDGTQDAEAGRAAIRDALSELLTRFPEADLLNLSDEQRAFAIERYVAIDVYRRFDLDVGKTIREKAPSATTALSRLKQVRDYVKETVAASFRRLRDAGRVITAGRVGALVREALKETFEVFEGYSE
ncbi:MAG TPA: Qat anti-phage system associated protein QatB [Pyrinomonadaceae bacterium]|nr:Qat anti-phage system associated protein QatB [Pyrinomonadaceae bacterium]